MSDNNSTNGKLQIVSLGGSGDIGKNMLAFRYDDTIIVVDCGVSFANEEQPGVDLIIPDISYLLEHREIRPGAIDRRAVGDRQGGDRVHGAERPVDH